MKLAETWIHANEAARRLNISRSTLYAYVSRGLIRSQPTAGSTRSHSYSHDDVERLRQRKEARRDPEAASAQVLRWGMPVLESSLTLIDGEMLYFRGHNAIELAHSKTVEEVASLIWTGKFESGPLTSRVDEYQWHIDRRSKLPFISRAQAALSSASAHDARTFDRRTDAVVICGRKILSLLTEVVTQRSGKGLTIDQQLAKAWSVGPHGTEVIRAALILSADHELNVSSFTARCIASAGSSPYGVVTGALAALEGPLHGGTSARVESALAAMRQSRSLRTDLEARLRRGERMDGFGHPLYPHGDPRATALMRWLAREYKESTELAFVQRFTGVARRIIDHRPNLDFGLAAVSRVLGLPEGSALALFAIGRTIGWIGHAIEQYATDQLIRPRARYVGVVPSISERD